VDIAEILSAEIERLREALAQPAQEPEMLTIAYQSGYHDGKKAALAGREPVAYVTGVYGGRFTYAPLNSAMVLPVGMALYAGPQREQNFCPRCGKRTNDIHTCTPPQGDA